MFASVRPLAEFLLQDRQARFAVCVELTEILESLTAWRLDDGCRAVASLNPDDRRRRPRTGTPAR
jgi:hypothetical protein